MDYSLIVTSIISSAGLFSLIQFFISRNDKKNDRIKEVEKKVDRLGDGIKRNELATTRLQLLWLVENHPENEDAILNTAQRYFVELDGNAEAWSIFYKWAEARKLDTNWYRMLIKKERS